MNVAYQPTAMLQADIGAPEPRADEALHPGDEAVRYMVHTQQPRSDYTLVGWSNETTLRHAELNETGELQTRCSYVYYAQRAPDSPHIPGTPQSAVLARRYTKGLVLYRAGLFTGDEAFMATLSEPIPLPGWYRRVSRVAGATELGEPTREIQLAGYEGAVLVRVPPPSPPSSPPAPPPPPNVPTLIAQLPHEVAVEFRAAGSPEDYGDGPRRRLVGAVAALAAVDAQHVHLFIGAGSVLVRVTIGVPSAAAGRALASSLAASLVDASAASAALGIQVESAPTVASRAVRTARSGAPILIAALTLVASWLLCGLCLWRRRRRRRRDGAVQGQPSPKYSL